MTTAGHSEVKEEKRETDSREGGLSASARSFPAARSPTPWSSQPTMRPTISADTRFSLQLCGRWGEMRPSQGHGSRMHSVAARLATLSLRAQRLLDSQCAAPQQTGICFRPSGEAVEPCRKEKTTMENAELFAAMRRERHERAKHDIRDIETTKEGSRCNGM